MYNGTCHNMFTVRPLGRAQYNKIHFPQFVDWFIYIVLCLFVPMYLGLSHRHPSPFSFVHLSIHFPIIIQYYLWTYTLFINALYFYLLLISYLIFFSIFFHIINYIIHLFFYDFVYLFISLFVCLFICLFFCLFHQLLLH